MNTISSYTILESFIFIVFKIFIREAETESTAPICWIIPPMPAMVVTGIELDPGTGDGIRASKI